MRLSNFLLLVILLFSFPAAILAQDSPSSAVTPSAQNAPTQTQTEPAADTLTFRTTVRRVIVDVVVRDSNNKPVHGLTASDFVVAEDGHPQNILSFDVFDLNKIGRASCRERV